MGNSTIKSKVRNKNFSRKISRLTLWRWHRRLGLTSALFVILLSATGLLLNHGNGLGLDQQSLPRPLLSTLYGVEAPVIRHFVVANSSVSQVGNRDLFIDVNPVGRCDTELLGALSVDSAFLLACRDSLSLVTPAGDLVDKIDGLSGLPRPIQSLGYCDQAPCFLAEGEAYSIDVDTMAWLESPLGLTKNSSASPPPDRLKDQLLAKAGSDITWERAIQDLHSGRLFGSLGPWVMDFMAILFMIIASTGVIMWGLGRGFKN